MGDGFLKSFRKGWSDSAAILGTLMGAVFPWAIIIIMLFAILIATVAGLTMLQKYLSSR